MKETVINAGGPVTPTIVEKAWGGELWFAVVDNARAGKVIAIAAGQSVSCTATVPRPKRSSC